MSDAPTEPDITEPTLWRRDGWTARVIKNEDDEGWAVDVRRTGMSEPALVSPWVMGRDKKNPKPFDQPAFATFVKTATEVLARSERQRTQALKKRLDLAWDGRWYAVTLEQIPDEFDPHAVLSAVDDACVTVAKFHVGLEFKLTREAADRWIRGGFARP